MLRTRKGPLLLARPWTFLLLFSLCFPSFLQATESAFPHDDDVSFGHFWEKCVSDLPRLIDEGNAPIFCVGTLATAYEWGTDDRRNKLRDDLKGLGWEAPFDLGNFYGEGWVEGGLGLSTWALGPLLDDDRLACFGRDATESLLTSTFLVSVLKLAVDRKRPNGGDLSFPSGHSITAFCFAPVVSKYWGEGAGAVAYALATLTGLARVEGSHHYLSDVIAGATLGILVGETVVRGPEGLSFTAAPGGVGLRLAFN